ncbi:hypothetical protein [Limnobacter sp.]|uniref:hypothetical protein n=1 Tax=Limnobacter sp. TaxID=2003368 RepID=UPI002734BF3E|nr:hypothetical protein [Limnobacter sp.]MDP3272796.1 hypothetical protein [Limnobacter sp.]
MPIFYPSVLPVPEVQGYGFTPQNNKVRTQFESGPARVRRIHRSPTTNFTVGSKLTREQLAIFEYWWVNEALDGSQWFETTLVNGVGLSTVDARAVDEYQVQALASEVFQLTWELEVRSKPLMNGNDYAVAAQGGADAFALLSDELDVIVNEEIPAI